MKNENTGQEPEAPGRFDDPHRTKAPKDAFYVYDGNSPKVHAGGYAFKTGRPVKVDESKLTDANREQFHDRGIRPADRLRVQSPDSMPPVRSTPTPQPVGATVGPVGGDKQAKGQ